MNNFKRPYDFFKTDEGIQIKRQLVAMSKSVLYNTKSTFSVNTQLYPDNLIPFVDRHMEYIRRHPALNAQQYLSNLRLMTLVR